MPWRRRRVTEEQGAPVPRGPVIWPWLLLLLLLVAGGIAAAFLLTRDSGPTTRVPDVVGRPVAEAVRELGQEGYAADVENRASSDGTLGTVLSQAPEAGTKLDRGEPVTIAVARGPGRSRVPRVVGLSAARALERLQAAGLKGRTVKVASRRPKDQVLRQSPAPGTELKKDSVVVLTTSKGRPTTPPGTQVPNVVGLAQRVAVARLQSTGFRVDSYPAPSARPRGTVTAQGPPGGARAAPQSVVRIDVSLGSGRRPLRTVPDVVGMTETQAKQVLVRVGFTVRSVDEAAADRSEKDLVLDQRPAAGGSRPVASQVIIVVGRFPPPTS
jgi:beta-lactam-binding protein with PASTA domain